MIEIYAAFLKFNFLDYKEQHGGRANSTFSFDSGNCCYTETGHLKLYKGGHIS